MAVKPIPEGYRSVTPYLTVTGAAQLLDFITAVFGGKEKFRMPRPDGTIGHAEVQIGDSTLMLAEASAQYPPMPAGLYVYVPDTDAAYTRALKAGATSLMEPADQFYGDRNAGVKDATGITWWIATHVEDVPPDEMEKRAAAKAK